MFSIFTKKVFLADYLENAVDLHCHILPAIDDGAVSETIALKMLEQYRNLGFHKIIATPHIMEDYYQNTKASVTTAFNDLTNKHTIAKEMILRPAAEYMLDGQMEKLIQKNEILPIHGKHVLVEMSYFQKPIHLYELLFALQNNGYEPIMAHPERYNYMPDTETYDSLIYRGCKMQLNMLSLSPHYGSGVQKKAFHLLQEGKISFIGTDAHRPEHLDKIKNLQVPKKLEKRLQQVVSQTKELFL